MAELVAEVSALLDDQLGRAWVAGEVSNLRRAPSGHAYFTLKDESAQLRAVLFRGDARGLPFELEDGLEVVVFAEVGVWAARGDLQLVVRHVEPRGAGALQLAFEQLRRRLEAEGLFDPASQRPLPPFPRRIGVVTSRAAAALRDVIQVARQRWGACSLLVSPARVQGEGADAELVRALEIVARVDEVDVVLLVRGGGSLEDLMAFNSELLARAIRACPVPVVTGVGHEVDFTIADLAADARAPTPSAAAALVVPDGRALRERVARGRSRLVAAVRGVLDRARARLGTQADALRRASPRARLEGQGRRLASARRALERAIRHRLERERGRFAARVARLDSLSPLAVLERGYAIVHRDRDGSIVRSPGDVAAGERLRIRVARGELAARVLAGGEDPADG